MDYKRILTIQDISCVGQCSLTAALPVLSACGVETAVLPSAVLSTHTGGFKGFTFRDLTDDMPAIADHWEKEKISFDAIYTGYLGSVRQISIVKDIASRLLKKGGLLIVDPAMADNGKLYTGFDSAFVEAMKELVSEADVVLPNITEAALLTGCEYRETYDEKYVGELVAGLTKLGAKQIVLTGVGYEAGTTGVLSVMGGNTEVYYRHLRYERGCHGTGDIFASAFVGALMHGKDLPAASKIAADFVLSCIGYSMNYPDHWYGAVFEPCIGKLCAALED